MPAEDDISIEEKRVYAGSAGRTDVYVASADGLVRVAISGDKIGEFGMVTDTPARDVAIARQPDGPDRLAVATPEDLLVGPIDAGDGSQADPDLEPVGIGPTTTVGLPKMIADSDHSPARVLAGTIDGEIIEVRTDGGVEPTTLGRVAEPRAIDSGLIAAADGVYRVTAGGTDTATIGGSGGSGGSGKNRGSSGSSSKQRSDLEHGDPTHDGLEHVGLDAVTDVAGSGVPLAATDAGLYWLANGWMAAIETATTRVAADGDGHALAVTDDGLFAHAGTDWSRDAWEHRSLPVAGTVTALAYGPGVAIAVTDAGALCVDAGDGWRHQILGLRESGAIATVTVS